MIFYETKLQYFFLREVIVIMKKFCVVVFFAFFSVHAFASEFCDGFERGYVTGYKQSSGSSFNPFVPYCPFKPAKDLNDPKSDYEYGYIIGYEKGLGKGF